MTKEIDSKNWEHFCRKISENHQGALVSIEVIEGETKVIAQNVPLKKLVWDPNSDACSSTLTIEAGSALQHRIVEPIHFILRKQSNGGERFHLLEIPAESGTTLVTFHPGITAEELGEIGRAGK